MLPDQRSDRLTSKSFPVGFDDPMYMIVNLAMGAKYFKGVESYLGIQRHRSFAQQQIMPVAGAETKNRTFMQ
jgi:hypothetical protein